MHDLHVDACVPSLSIDWLISTLKVLVTVNRSLVLFQFCILQVVQILRCLKPIATYTNSKHNYLYNIELKLPSIMLLVPFL